MRIKFAKQKIIKAGHITFTGCGHCFNAKDGNEPVVELFPNIENRLPLPNEKLKQKQFKKAWRCKSCGYHNKEE